MFLVFIKVFAHLWLTRVIAHTCSRSRTFHAEEGAGSVPPPSQFQFWRFRHHLTVFLFCVIAIVLKNRCPRLRWIWCRQSWRHKETIDTGCTAQFVTHQEVRPKNDSYTLNKYWWEQVALLIVINSAMPRAILRLSICNFQPRIWTTCANKRKACPIAWSIFQTVMVAVVLFGSLYRSYLEQNKTKNGAGFPFVGWCMINTVSKNHIKIRKIERGIAKQRLCQHVSTLAGPARSRGGTCFCRCLGFSTSSGCMLTSESS